MRRVSGVQLLLLLTGCMATYQDGTVLAPGASTSTVGFEVIDNGDFEKNQKS